MPEIGTSGSMSGDGKRSVAEWPKLPRLILDSTHLISRLRRLDRLFAFSHLPLGRKMLGFADCTVLNLIP